MSTTFIPLIRVNVIYSDLLQLVRAIGLSSLEMILYSSVYPLLAIAHHGSPTVRASVLIESLCLKDFYYI